MSRAADLQAVLEKKISEMNDFAKIGIKVDGANVEVSSDDRDKYLRLRKEAGEVKDLLEAEIFGTKTMEWMNGSHDSAALDAAIQAKMKGMGIKSLGRLFTDSEEFKDLQKSGRLTMATPYELEAGNITREAMQAKDIYSDLSTHVVNRGIGTVIQFDPMVPRAQRPLRVRDLFPQAGTSSNLIDYFQVIGFVENAGDGNAQTVPDYSGGAFGLKPHSNLNFRSAQAPVRTLAHWEAVHRHIIQDVPQLQATINNELLYGLALVEDDQILNGDGTGENLRGILQTPGIQTYPAPGSELFSDSLRKASTLAVLANYPPTGYVLHPNDWETIELQKGTTNDHYMLWTNIAVGLNAQVWRQPVVETPAMDEGTFLNGAFGTGAQVYDRQQASVRIAEQHADFFVRNAVVVLCEERLALAVKRPEAFVKGTFG